VWDFVADSCRFCGDDRRGGLARNPDFIGISRLHQARTILRNGCALSAWRGRDVLVEGVGVLYLKIAPPDRPNGAGRRA